MVISGGTLCVRLKPIKQYRTETKTVDAVIT